MPGFFDRVKEGLEKGVNTVSVKSKELLDSTKLKRELDTLLQNKADALSELGLYVHTSIQDNSFSQDIAKEKSDAIIAIEAQIKEKEAEIEQVHLKTQENLGKPVEKKCSCGEVVPEGAKFCSSCGAKIE